MIDVVSQKSDGFVVFSGALGDSEAYDPAMFLVEQVDETTFPDPFALYWRWSDGSYHESPEV